MKSYSFNIICLMTVKNEVDIVIDVLDKASIWAKYIIVMDNGSTDGTSEKLERYSKLNQKVIYWGQYNGKFNDNLRQRLFYDFKELFFVGDWICRLDSDEFYIDDPRDFIQNIKSNKVDSVYNASFNFYLTVNDIDENTNYLNLQHYSCNSGECRFVKIKENMFWPQGNDWPLNNYCIYEKLIRVKHYQYRSLKQIKNRVSVRVNNTEDRLFSHEKKSGLEWYKRRGFEILPSDIFYIENKIVDPEDLNSSLSFKIPSELENKILPSRKYLFKRYVFSKLSVICFPVFKLFKIN